MDCTSNSSSSHFGCQVAGICESPPSICSWPKFNTLAICSSIEDISEEIIQDGPYVTLPALQSFLTPGEDPPSFLSRPYLYMKEGQTSPNSLPKTSAMNGTNLPDLSEIYYLFYDICVDQQSVFNKTDIKRWKAFKGRFQFCVHVMESDTTHHSGTRQTVIGTKENLTWYKTNQFNETSFCTKVESEKEDFCVSESLMESLSTQMSSMFNVTAFFNDSNRDTIIYSSEWGPILTHDIFAGIRDTEPFCPEEPNPQLHVYHQLGGFASRLDSVGASLNT